MNHLFNIFRTNTHPKNDNGKNKQKQKIVSAQKVVGSSKNVDKKCSEVSRIRLPNFTSLLK